MNVFVGQLMLVPYTFAPRGFAFCQGQLLSISQNTALFSLLGTQYGGDGRSTFALPNLQGTLSTGAGNSPLGNYVMGESGGALNVTLQLANLAAHNHSHMGLSGPHTTSSPAANNFASSPPRVAGGVYAAGPPSNPTALNAGALQFQGGNQAHSNIMPTLALNYIIALQGIFPSRP